jgi:hypothetical protein
MPAEVNKGARVWLVEDNETDAELCMHRNASDLPSPRSHISRPSRLPFYIAD